MAGAELRLGVSKGKTPVTLALVAPNQPTPMQKLMNQSVRATFCFVASVLLIFGCSGRKVPSTLPESSPASLSAEEAPPMLMTRALDEDPPLPSEDTHGWKGLRPAENAKAHDHHHEHGHEGHGDHQSPAKAEESPAAPKEHDHAAHTGHPEQEAPSKKENADSYTCPMHPEVVTDKPGRCPRCGMNLEKKR